MDKEVFSVIEDLLKLPGATYRASPDQRFRIAKDLSAITCLDCNRTSHNLHDVRQRYCGHCHVFHGEA